VGSIVTDNAKRYSYASSANTGQKDDFEKLRPPFGLERYLLIAGRERSKHMRNDQICLACGGELKPEDYIYGRCATCREKGIHANKNIIRKQEKAIRERGKIPNEKPKSAGAEYYFVWAVVFLMLGMASYRVMQRIAPVTGQYLGRLAAAFCLSGLLIISDIVARRFFNTKLYVIIFPNWLLAVLSILYALFYNLLPHACRLSELSK
jgi:hypothetical protein